MKRASKKFSTIAVLLLLCACALCQNSTVDCGRPADGIALCLSRSEQGVLILEVKNTGEKDAVLNLGIMLANGARQYPSAITLTLRDAEGREHQCVLFEPAVIAGRLDPFILPLPKGAGMRLPIDLSKYLLMTGRHIEDPPKPDTTKQYLVRAEFAGEGVTQAQANLDVKGLALMPFWLGKAVSNTVKSGPD